MLGVNEAGGDSTYLGLPNIVGHNKTALLGFLKGKMRKRIQGWEGRLLSRPRKELLIKTVAQSLPSYAMNVFLLLVETCNEIKQLMCKFWWRSSKNNKGIHWKKWDRLTVHKSKVGMGFRNLRDFNLSLICKQGWRLFSHPDSLVSKLFKARYYRNGTFLNAELGSNPNDDNPRVTSINPALVDQNVKALMETDSLAWDINLKLSVPPKVKDLLWQAATNCLPTKTRLRSRYVPVDVVFPVCKDTDETIYHSLVDCSFAKGCWQRLATGVNLTAVGSLAN
ncbi:hypothetical protein CsatA_023065 [Cannabis sativa]